MGHPMITTEESRWLREILYQIRIMSGKISSGGLSGVTLLADFVVGSGGGAPANGTDTYANPALDGKTLKVYKNGAGYLTETTDYTTITGGGIELTSPAVFTTSERYLIFSV